MDRPWGIVVSREPARRTSEGTSERRKSSPTRADSGRAGLVNESAARNSDVSRAQRQISIRSNIYAPLIGVLLTAASATAAWADYPAVASTSSIPMSPAHQTWCAASGVANQCALASAAAACTYDAYYWGATGGESQQAEAGAYAGEYAGESFGSNP